MQPDTRRLPGTHAPLVVAHRGAWEAAPQNSLAAFARAIELGCDMIELDVRRTRDARLVVVHDARARGAPVGSLEYAELRGRLGDGHPPLLEEVLDLVAGRIRADVELKESGYEEQAMALVRERLPQGSFVVELVPGRGPGSGWGLRSGGAAWGSASPRLSVGAGRWVQELRSRGPARAHRRRLPGAPREPDPGWDPGLVSRAGAPQLRLDGQ